MIDTYKVTKLPQIEAFLVEGNFMPGCFPVNIPEDEPMRRTFISRFLQREDINVGIRSLEYMSEEQPYCVNVALFKSALTNLMKCFQSSSMVTMLNEKSLERRFPDEYVEFKKFKNWRNKHFIHDENRMRETVALLFVAPPNSGKILGGNPSVIWNTAPINYFEESKRLKQLMEAVIVLIDSEIDCIGTKLYNKYCQLSREELLSFGRADIRLGTCDSPDQKREIIQKGSPNEPHEI